MREIKFRGKRIDNGEWVFGDLGRRKSRFVEGIQTVGISDEFGKYIGVTPKTVGQFTGLLDKNGVEIYEGDIISTNGIDGLLNWQCYCDEETYDFSFWPIGHEYCSTHNGAFEEDEREVIGNIHTQEDDHE